MASLWISCVHWKDHRVLCQRNKTSHACDDQWTVQSQQIGAKLAHSCLALLQLILLLLLWHSKLRNIFVTVHFFNVCFALALRFLSFLSAFRENSIDSSVLLLLVLNCVQSNRIFHI